MQLLFVGALGHAARILEAPPSATSLIPDDFGAQCKVKELVVPGRATEAGPNSVHFLRQAPRLFRPADAGKANDAISYTTQRPAFQ